jgi:hypothetical protein
MSLLLLLLACRGGADEVTEPPATSPPVQPAPAPTTAPDPSPTTTTDATEPPFVVDMGGGPVEPHEVPVVVTGGIVDCDGGELLVETVGDPDEVLATPWLNGVAGTPVSLVLSDAVDATFRTHHAELAVDGCHDAIWLLEASDGQGTHCRWLGDPQSADCDPG